MSENQSGKEPDQSWEAAAQAAAQTAAKLAGAAAKVAQDVAQEGVKRGVKYGARQSLRGDLPFFFGGHAPWARGPWHDATQGAPPKAKRGDVRAAILALLAEGPRNGYQIIQEVEDRTDGTWKPSPGAVYPALQQLADEGLIEGTDEGGRKTFHLTDAGRTYIEENPRETAPPWASMKADLDGDIKDLFKEAAQLGAALMQVVRAGSKSDVTEARRVIVATRRKLYRILADEDES
jgi:DNA-binding PadR family transcriptional regulator